MDTFDLSEFLDKTKCAWCGREGQVLMTAFDGRKICRLKDDEVKSSKCWRLGVQRNQSRRVR